MLGTIDEYSSQTSMEDNVLSNGKKLNMIYKQTVGHK